jgi:hypothetical protein
MKKIIVILVLLVTGTLVFGCSGDGYQKTVETKRGIRFSFEFPESYQDPAPEWDDDWSVYLYREVKEGNIEDTDTRFTIMIFDPGREIPESKSKLEQRIEDYSQSPSGHEFELIERSDVEVSGVRGELVVYTFRYLGSFEILESNLSIVRSVYLDYKSKIWNIEIVSHPEVAEQAKQEFEHIIESFKFLD